MAKDWKNIDIKSIAKKEAEKTDDQLASLISSFTRMTDEDVKKLFPDKGDVAKLLELMKIVKSTDSKNAKIKKLTENGEKFGSVIVKLLQRFV